jgi:hypothetical protein
MNTLQRKIMRQIYYVYALRTVFQPVVVHGFLMLSLMILLTYFVSIGNVITNMMNIKVGNLGTFFYNAVSNTEAWTLIILGILIFSVFSLRFAIAPARRMAQA